MANIVVVGAQWGDEGKGKIIDILTEKTDLIVRYQGGNNAGHTVVIGKEEFILHLIPSGILHPDKICLIGNGVVVNPKALLEEMDSLRARGVKINDNLFVSDNAHLIMPYHQLLDAVGEKKAIRKIGTTRRGIGPAYVDKMERIGIRIADLLDREVFKEKLERNLAEKNEILGKVYGIPPLKKNEIIEEYLSYGEKIRKMVVKGSHFINQAIREGKSVLFEGAQGTLLDVDHGTYPYVTSSSPVAGGACIGLGVGPTKIDRVIGVAKAYTTRVGEGPFPTEFTPELDEKMRLRGREYGATTGRPRRCGWFDAVGVRHSVEVNGLDSIAITKLDVLDETESIKICLGYKYKGEVINEFPSNTHILEKCEPIYEEMPGWMESISKARECDDLPPNARRYLEKLTEILEVKICLVSVGAEREQTIILDEELLS